MKTYTQEEFIELVNSGDFNIIKESQLEDEGWEYDEISGDYTNPFDEDSIAINDSIFSLETFSMDNVKEIDMSDNTFKLETGDIEEWFPMGVIEKEEHLIEPIKLDIPDYEEL